MMVHMHREKLSTWKWTVLKRRQAMIHTRDHQNILIKVSYKSNSAFLLLTTNHLYGNKINKITMKQGSERMFQLLLF